MGAWWLWLVSTVLCNASILPVQEFICDGQFPMHILMWPRIYTAPCQRIVRREPVSRVLFWYSTFPLAIICYCWWTLSRVLLFTMLVSLLQRIKSRRKHSHCCKMFQVLFGVAMTTVEKPCPLQLDDTMDLFRLSNSLAKPMNYLNLLTSWDLLRTTMALFVRT